MPVTDDHQGVLLSETQITGAQSRAAEVAAALDKVAIAVADAAAVVADLNVALTRDRQTSETARSAETARSGETARRGGGTAPGPVSSYVDFEPGLGFADWRCEVLSLLEAS